MVSKKKKKTSSNPARGFATTSTPSKAKVQEEEEKKAQLESLPVQENTSEADGKDLKTEPAQEKGSSKAEEADLTPEAYAEQLEDNEVELILEKHGERILREAKRIVSRLEEERRSMRDLKSSSCAQVDVEELLDENGIDEIIKEVKASFKPDGVTPYVDNLACLLEIWKLYHVLEDLGFKETHIKEVLQAGVWTVDDAMEYLILSHPEDQLPSPKNFNARVPKDGQLLSQLAIAEPPIKEISPKRLEVQNLEISEVVPISDEPSKEISSESEMEDDIDPDALISHYLRYMEKRSRITGIWVAEVSKKSKKSAKGIPVTSPAPLTKELSRRVSKLESKIEAIKSDPLFDSREASELWAKEVSEYQKNLIAQARSQNKRSTLGSVNQSNDTISVSLDNENSKTKERSTNIDEQLRLESSSSRASSPGLGMRIFEENEEKETNAGTKSLTLAIPVRDFGKVSETAPTSKKVLDEAMKTRYSDAKLIFRDAGSFSTTFKMELCVTWGVNQNLPAVFPAEVEKAVGTKEELKSVTYSIHTMRSHDGKSVTTHFKMVDISCPSTIQAECYIATIALFYLFPEDKFHLRLNSSWKGLWTELLTELQKRHHDAEKALIKWVRQTSEGLMNNVSISETKVMINSKPKADEVSNAFYEPLDALTAQQLQDLYMAKTSTEKYQSMLNGRCELPIWNQRSQLLEAINQNQITIIRGETGCGKSTQLPAYIVEDCLAKGQPCRVLVTEPRRISAISLAKRVSEELGEPKNELGNARSFVGYSIRLEARVNPKTRLIYATTGVVMRMCERGDSLAEATHLVLDEVHERSIESDFLLLILKETILKARPDLKVILMSATVDAGKFSEYFNGAPVISVPGRTYPVQTFYLEDAIESTNYPLSEYPGSQKPRFVEEYDVEDTEAINASSTLSYENYSVRTQTALIGFDDRRINYDLIAQLMYRVTVNPEHKPFSQAILVFLPGWKEIQTMRNFLLSSGNFDFGWIIHVLHSQVAMEEQERAFLRPPRGVRKVVLATNIAETGITIPDITCVIDTCKSKESRFDEKRQLSRLLEVFISRANAKQRRGRAGRVQEGLCFHLVTKEAFDRYLPENQIPEMLRLSLQDIILRIKMCKMGGVAETLNQALDQPISRNVIRAIDSLMEVKALTSKEELTLLGRYLAELPVDVYIGKLLLLGALYGCLDACVTIGSLLSAKTPWIQPTLQRDRVLARDAMMTFATGDSDLLTTYNAYSQWRSAVVNPATNDSEFCRKNWINGKDLYAIEEGKIQLFVALADSKIMMLEPQERSSLNRARNVKRGEGIFFAVPDRYNMHSFDSDIVGSVIAAGFYPKIIAKEGKGYRDIAKNQPLKVNMTSVNRNNPIPWLSYYSIFKSNNMNQPDAFHTTRVSEVSLALLCGEVEFKFYAGAMAVDSNRIRVVFSSWRGMEVIRILRRRLAALTSQKWKYPDRPMSAEDQKWYDIVIRILGRDILKAPIQLAST